MRRQTGRKNKQSTTELYALNRVATVLVAALSHGLLVQQLEKLFFSGPRDVALLETGPIAEKQKANGCGGCEEGTETRLVALMPQTVKASCQFCCFGNGF